jgi:hypothetical protein
MITEDRHIEITVAPSTPFARVPLWLVRHADVGDRAVRLYATLAGYADNKTGKCWPSRTSLAADLRCSTDSIDRAAKELIQAGGVTVQHRFDADGNKLPNMWTLHIDPPSRTGAATPSRTPAATLAAPVRHRTRPNELDTPEPAEAGVVDAPKAESEESSPTKPRRADRLTPYRDALVKAFGVDPGTIAGKRGWGPWNAAAKDLADAGIDAEEIPARLQQLRDRDRWRDRITPVVLVQEWATLVAADAPVEPARVADLDAAITYARSIRHPDDTAEDLEQAMHTAGFLPDEIQSALDTLLTPTP